MRIRFGATFKPLNTGLAVLAFAGLGLAAVESVSSQNMHWGKSQPAIVAPSAPKDEFTQSEAMQWLAKDCAQAIYGVPDFPIKTAIMRDDITGKLSRVPFGTAWDGKRDVWLVAVCAK